MSVLPAIDLMNGQCVRLQQGRYDRQTIYGQTPIQMAQLFERMGYDWLHVIDLDGARAGESQNLKTIEAMVKQTALRVQVGGGIRSLETIEQFLELGVDRVLIGSMAVCAPELLKEAIERFGPERIVVCMDVKEGKVRISGWEEDSGLSPNVFIENMLALGVTTILCTDISRDGMMLGPNVSLYQDLKIKFPTIEWIAAGGVGLNGDVEALESVGITQAVVGKAFYEGSLLSKRVIACLDIKDGRTVKGTNFVELKDAGDPVELAKRYEQEGVDELVFLDITATSDRRELMTDLVSRVAEAISIPFTVGGGIRSIDDIKSALLAGADKVSIESLAVIDPDFISEAVNFFGSQAIVISVSPKRVEGADRWEVYIKGGRENTGIDLIDFLKDMQAREVGEILLNSIDEDGKGEGYDVEMLRAASEVLTIPLIASSGAGELEHFYDGLQAGADAVLAASVFHYGKFSVGMVKHYLQDRNISIRITQ
jgi:phosphoribosylformimino-5-aminoimidazole carboxamide ribotide isomerase